MYPSTALPFCPKPPQSGTGDMEMRGVRLFVRYSVSPSVCSRYFVSALRFLFVDQLISNLHTSIILGISSFSSKLGKIKMSAKTHKNFKVLLFQRKWIFRRFWPEECDSNKCDLRIAAIAAIIMGILAVIFNMVTKTHKQFHTTYQFSLKFEHFESLRILAAILKMAAKMTAILKSHWSRSHSSKNH
jgi:hypothetical protein